MCSIALHRGFIDSYSEHNWIGFLKILLFIPNLPVLSHGNDMSMRTYSHLQCHNTKLTLFDHDIRTHPIIHSLLINRGGWWTSLAPIIITLVQNRSRCIDTWSFYDSRHHQRSCEWWILSLESTMELIKTFQCIGRCYLWFERIYFSDRHI